MTGNTVKASFSIIWLAISSFSTMLVSIGAAAILSRFLSKEVYGTYKQILFVYTALQVVFVAGIPGVYSFFLPKFPNLSQARYVVRKLNQILFVLGLIFGVFLYSFSGIIAELLRNDGLSQYLKLFSMVPVLSLPTVGIQGLLISYNKAKLFSVYNIVAKLSIFVATILPVIIGRYDLYSILFGWIIGTAINLVMAMWLKLAPFRNVEIQKANITLSNIFTYSMPILLASLLGLVSRSADQFFISRYFGLAVFAEYSNGFIPVPLVGIITASVSSVLLARVSALYHSANFVRIKTTWIEAIDKSIVLIYPILVYSLVYSEEIVEFIYGENYSNSSNYFKVSIIGSFINIVTMSPLMYGMNLGSLYLRNIAIGLLFVWLFDVIVVQLGLSPVWIAVGAACKEILVFILNLNRILHVFKLGLFDVFSIRRYLQILALSTISVLATYFLLRFFDLNGTFLLMSGLASYAIVLLALDWRLGIGILSLAKDLRGD